MSASATQGVHKNMEKAKKPTYLRRCGPGESRQKGREFTVGRMCETGAF